MVNEFLVTTFSVLPYLIIVIGLKARKERRPDPYRCRMPPVWLLLCFELCAAFSPLASLTSMNEQWPNFLPYIGLCTFHLDLGYWRLKSLKASPPLPREEAKLPPHYPGMVTVGPERRTNSLRFTRFQKSRAELFERRLALTRG